MAGNWDICNLGITLFQQGDFTLNSGAKSTWKLECDALTDADWDGVAAMVRLLVPQYRTVIGIPRGGLKLAERLRPHAIAGPLPILVVDDVLTTGGSMEKVRKELIEEMHDQQGDRFSVFNPENRIDGVVLFARGLCPWWIKAIFQMPKTFWINSQQQQQQ